MTRFTKRLVTVVAAFAVCLTMTATVPATARLDTPPVITASAVQGTPDDFWFHVTANRARVFFDQGDGDEADLSVQATLIDPTTGLPVVYQYDDPWAWFRFDPGMRQATVHFRLITVDPALQPQAADFTFVKMGVYYDWVSLKSVSRWHRYTSTIGGTSTTSRSYTPLLLGGNANWRAYGGRLLVTSLFARAATTYTFTASGRRAQFIGRASWKVQAGLYPPHTTGYTTHTSKTTMRVTLITSNPSGFAQAWIRSVTVHYRALIRDWKAVHHFGWSYATWGTRAIPAA